MWRMKLAAMLWRLLEWIEPDVPPPTIPPEPKVEIQPIRDSDGTWTEEFTELEKRLG